jgi:hypothetical protein
VTAMAHYRIYFLDETGHVFEAQDCDAADDLSAFNKASILSKDRHVEVWQSSRCVAKIVKGGTAMPLEQSASQPPEHLED